MPCKRKKEVAPKKPTSGGKRKCGGGKCGSKKK
jgi:hypothetical protein